MYTRPDYTDERAMRRLAERWVTGVVVPTLDFAVVDPRPFDACAMLACGMRPAPGHRSLSELLGRVPAACDRARRSAVCMPPAVALRAATVDDAPALGLDDSGTLAPSKLAALQVWSVSTHELGRNPVTTVLGRGWVHIRSGRNRS